MRALSEMFLHYHFGFDRTLKMDYKIILITIAFLLFLSEKTIAQDSIAVAPKGFRILLEGRTEPLIGESLHPLVVINGVVIRDSISVRNFSEKYLNSVKKISYLDQKQALKKYGINSKDGILLIYVKNKILVDFNFKPSIE